MHYVIIYPEIITFLNLPTEVLLNAAKIKGVLVWGQRERILSWVHTQGPNGGLDLTT